MPQVSGSKVERVTSKDLKLLDKFASGLRPLPDEPARPGLIRDINKIILDCDERKLRLVYFFAKGLK